MEENIFLADFGPIARIKLRKNFATNSIKTINPFN